MPANVKAEIDAPWRDIVGLRNVIAHQYDAINYDLLLALREKQIPDLVKSIEVYLSNSTP